MNINLDGLNPDITRTKAERLVRACNDEGLPAVLHWDRSPWCCKVFLTDDHDEYAPAAFFYVEDTDSCKIPNGGWIWQSQIVIDRELPEQEDLNDISFEILERTWLDDDELNVARKIALFLSMVDVSAMLISEQA
jgi:hypothetical protein